MKQNTLECQFCGDTFVTKRNDARYCCNSHRQLAYLLRDRRRYSRNNDLNSIEFSAAREEKATLAELRKLSARVDAIKATFNLELEKKQESEAVDAVESIVNTLEEVSRNNALDKVKKDTLKIIEALFNQDANGEIAERKIKWLISDVTLLLNSASFENVQAEFRPAKFMQEILLPHLEQISRSIRRSGEWYIEYEIPTEMKRELQKICDELKYTRT